jgi:hypothetical protein
MIDNRPDNQISYHNVNGESKMVKTIQFEALPTDPTNTNPDTAITYDAYGQIATMTKTINGVNYVKTYTWTSGSLTGISKWVVA